MSYRSTSKSGGWAGGWAGGQKSEERGCALADWDSFPSPRRGRRWSFCLFVSVIHNAPLFPHHRMYRFKNLRWNAERTVSLMKSREPSFLPTPAAPA